MTKRINDHWNRCDRCGRFIAIKDFDTGAIRKLATPDTAFTSESYTTLCKHCATQRQRKALKP